MLKAEGKAGQYNSASPPPPAHPALYPLNSSAVAFQTHFQPYPSFPSPISLHSSFSTSPISLILAVLISSNLSIHRTPYLFLFCHTFVFPSLLSFAGIYHAGIDPASCWT
uniref:Uncharacterized protein n=1 Tax=Anguilla anguilla TaxID=7936 RepID=A0A0E9R912_ANGAN